MDHAVDNGGRGPGQCCAINQTAIIHLFIGMAPVERGAIVLYYNVARRPNMVMGLPISNALASLHGSRLDISSTLIEGKTVVIYLPANENSA